MCCCSATTTRTTSILFWRSPLACAAAAGKCGQRHCLHHHQVNVVTGVFCTTAMESAAADKAWLSAEIGREVGNWRIVFRWFEVGLSTAWYT